MVDSDLSANVSARELALRERQLDLEERKLRPGLGDAIKGLALPVASLVVSAAIFVIQIQQQNFERTLNSVREGYKTYFDRIAPIRLQTYDDFYEAKRALQMTTQIYPEIFCGARNDLIWRIQNATMEVDRAPLIDEINALPAPDPSNGVAQPRWLKLAWLEPRVPACAVLPRAGPAGRDAKDDLPPASSSIAASETSVTPRSAAMPADAPLTPATPSHSYRVFVQTGPNRDLASLETMRESASAAGFRMTEARQTRRPFQAPSVRYFDPGQADDAAMLADYLNKQFAGESLVFTTQSAGRNYQNLPQDTLEVWIPDAAPAPLAKPRPRLLPSAN
jgi:hypothetical protein